MRNKLILAVEELYLKSDIPELHVGDTLSVSVKIKEGTKERVQKFDGVLLAKRGTGTNSTITVRKISSGIGVERNFLIHSPQIESIKITSSGRAKVRRAKLYYLRKLQGKKARLTYSMPTK
jgi:large subunit ribosomal protein L19